MIEINWKIFEAKFSGKEQETFEWLCYLLFCKECDQPKGISRYTNQVGIETNPIDFNGEKIGFQAKFYNTRLSEHKRDLIKSIDDATRKYPGINKIFFYINKDSGQGSSPKPKYIIKIENHAQSKNISIVWKTASFFESPFVCEENERIAQYFFSNEKSIFDFINKLSSHTKLILQPIQSEIIYKGNKIKIDRSNILKTLEEALKKSPAIILSGEAGVGKTAIIKNFYDNIENKNSSAFFIFKAMEFKISHINSLLKNYGNFTFIDFAEEFQNVNEKYIVIDSAEKLSDIENQEPFKEFLSSLLKYGWKAIFTVRHSYLDDLKYQLSNIYNINSTALNVTNLKTEELIDFSKNYNFNLPTNQKFCGLLQIPFYFSEYLKNYNDLIKNADYSDFKKIIWERKILNSSYRQNNTHKRREECFLKIVQKRVDTNCFFVTDIEYDNKILYALQSDEIIEYDPNSGGYFITHDICEEWALDKIIERDFVTNTCYKNFYQNIGDSLSIRRAFRGWLSEKLFISDENAKRLIEVTINDTQVESHWKDEILVSVLLSDYCYNFFKIFESELLKTPQKMSDSKSQYTQGLLYKILFLLRIACKEADESIFNILPKINQYKEVLRTIFTKPKGKGWDCTIDFINKHKEEIGLHYITFISQIIDDWNQKNKQGDTTKNSSQLALFYYKKNINDFKYNKEIEKQIIRTILNGSFEIKDELIKIFQLVISKKITNYDNEHYELIHTILSSIEDCVEIVKHLPEQVIALADLSWFKHPHENMFQSGRDIKEFFSVTTDDNFNYYPPSALKTPIPFLLISSFKQTVDFILSFTNKTIDSFTKSKFTNELEEVEVLIDKKNSIKQYISGRLWNMYRGTQTSPHLLESIHMALESYFLTNCQDLDSNILENHLLYLLKNSKSASITAVVTSIVLAYPEKTFNVAKVLFQTKEFFLYDKKRLTSDQIHTFPLASRFNESYIEQLYADERNKSDRLNHRKRMSLEELAFYYQLPQSNNKEVKNRQKVLWKIFDEYYQQLPSNEIESDKIWRLCLARMDIRKMRQKVEEIDGKSFIRYQSEMDPQLKKHSEEKLKEISNQSQYQSLRLWAEYKFKNNKEKKYKQFKKYENNPKLVIKDIRSIIKTFNKIRPYPLFPKGQQLPSFDNDQNDINGFLLINYSIPLYACAVLIRDYFDQLSQRDKIFCKRTIIKYVLRILQNGSQYYVITNTSMEIATLPLLINLFPEEKDQIKRILLKLLVEKEGMDFNDPIIIKAISDIWQENFEDAHSLFLGYLLLKPKFDDLLKEIQKENYKNHNYKYEENKILKSFSEKYKKEIGQVITNKLTYKTLSEECHLTELNLNILITAFELLPLKTKNEEHKKFANLIIPICTEKIFIQNNRANNYELKSKFLNKFSHFVLASNKNEIKQYLQPFINNFYYLRKQKNSENFFANFILAEDNLNECENFWIVWNIFYPKIVEISHSTSYSFFDKAIIHNYLLVGALWKKDKTNLHTLRDQRKLFFKKVSKDMGHHPSVLYSVSILLNDIENDFREDGIFLISDMIKNNPPLSTENLEINTVFYMENIARRYVLNNRYKIKTTLQIKEQILIILNFLIEKGSATAYRLREDIL